MKLATHKTVEANREPFSLLTINGGSSSIRFSVYEGGETLRRSLDGKGDRIGLSGTNLPVNDSAGRPQVPLRLAADDHRTAVGFLLDWLEAQPVLASVKAAGHRVVHGVKHSEPERVTPKLRAELHRKAALVPVVEPEVLMDGEHTLGRCSEVTEEVLRSVFNQLYEQRVLLEGILLKPNCKRSRDCAKPSVFLATLRVVRTFFSGLLVWRLAVTRKTTSSARTRNRPC